MSRARNFARTSAQKRKPVSPSENIFLSGNRRIAGLSILLAVATVALYIPVFGCPFVVMDDQTYVTGNPHVQEGLSWSTIRWAFTSTETAAYWHPVTWLSHTLDCQLFGLNPAGHHIHSVLIHALNVVLLFLLLVWMTGRVGASLLVAALFAVHPLNVESVAWVAERKNVLCTLFFLLTIGAYVWYVRRPHWQRYLAVVGLFAVALMAKPMVTTLPCVLLLLDYWPLNRTPLNGQVGQVSASGIARVGWARLILEKIPLLLLSAASSRITMITQGRVELTMAQLPFRARAENALVSYGLYLWKMLWPAHLAAFYPHPLTIPAWQWLSATLVLLVGTVLVVIFRRKQYLPVGWFWFLGTLVPAIGFVQVWKQAMADRFAYIPLIGIFVMMAWGFDDWAEARRLRTVWRVVPALCVLLVLASVSVRQMGYWGSQYDLWSRALEVEESPFAHSALGVALVTGSGAMSPRDLETFDTWPKRIEAARQHFEREVEMCRQQAQTDPDCLPEMVTALNDLSSLDRAQNRPVELQRARYEEALQIARKMHPQDAAGEYRKLLATTLINLGNLNLDEKDLDGKHMDAARQNYEESLSIDRQLIEEHHRPTLSSMAAALTGLAQINRQQDRPDDARQNYEEAANIFRQLAEKDPHAYLPSLAQVLNARAALDKKQNRMEEARADYANALKVYRSLALRDPDKYADDVAEVEANLAELRN